MAGLARAWPQVAHIIVRPEVHGVSSLTWLLSLCSFISWLAIGIVEHIVPTIAFNSLAGIGAATVLVLLVQRGHLDAWLALLVIATTACANLAVLVAFGAVGTSMFGVSLAVITVIPQLVKVFRHSTAGVSPASWWLSLTASVLWILYGTLIDEWVLIAPGLFMVPAAAAILWRVAAGSADRGASAVILWRIRSSEPAPLPVGDESVTRGG